MKLNIRKYFKDFLKSELTKNNAEEIYQVFWTLEEGESILFRNCCKILGIEKEKFLENFRGLEEMQYAEDEGCEGFTQIAVAEKFGTIEYEFPDEPSYGSIKEITLDYDNPEVVEFNHQLFSSAAHDIVDGFKESEYSKNDILYIVGRIGVFKDKQIRCLYDHTARHLVEIEMEMDKFNLQASLNEHDKPSEAFRDNFNRYYNSLGEYKQPEALIALVGVAKGIVEIVEQAGHDCLPAYKGRKKSK